MRLIKKSIKQKQEELRQSLYRLDGALNRYKVKREVAELGTVAIELRGLICIKGALLINLAEYKNFPLEFFTVPQELLNNRSSGQHEPTIGWTADTIGLESKPPWTRKINIKDLLTMHVAEVKGRQFTTMRLINEIASSVGPAHYPQEVSNALTEMSKYQLGGVPSQFRTLVNVSEVLLELGHKLLSSFGETE